MNLLLLIAILVGTQIGLSDGLILPTLVVAHGEGTFLVVYAFLKLLFILPVLQAELVAGRLYRVTPFEFSFQIMDRVWTRTLFFLLLAAVMFVMATNFFNTSWAMIFSIDGLQGELLSLRPLDQNLYWFEQSQNTNRIMGFVIAQGVLLMVIGGLAWRGVASIFLVIIPFIALFILFRLPDIVMMLIHMNWPAMTFSDFLVAMQHALTSSMAGLLVWYVLGTRVADHLPTGRVIISVQLFDVLFGMAMLSISWHWISAFGATELDAGSVFRVLMSALEDATQMSLDVSLWLMVLALVGVISSMPLLFLVARNSNHSPEHGLLAYTMLAIIVLSAGLVLSYGIYSPLTWYGRPLYEVVQMLGQGVIVPLLSAGVSLWIGWKVRPNRVLQQINPHGGIRYFLWRFVLKFVVPLVLGLIFVRATISLIEFNIVLIGAGLLVTLLIIRLVSWVRERAIFP